MAGTMKKKKKVIRAGSALGGAAGVALSSTEMKMFRKKVRARVAAVRAGGEQGVLTSADVKAFVKRKKKAKKK